MSNHFHLLVQTPQANLSEFMRHFLVTYTVRFNRRNGRTGHVFQGRFKSLLVDEDEYLLPLSRYIHLNPIRTSQFKDADFPTKSEYLKEYPWSTFPGYCYLRKRNKNIDYDWFLSTYFGGDTAKGRRHCREYVFNTIEGGNWKPIWRGGPSINSWRSRLCQLGAAEITTEGATWDTVANKITATYICWAHYRRSGDSWKCKCWESAGSKNKTKRFEADGHGAELSMQ